MYGQHPAIRLITAALVCLFLCGCASVENVSSLTETYPVCINEVMSSNSAYPDENGNYYDWIELVNRSDTDFVLTGYKLTDNQTTVKYIFPTGTVIKAGSCLVVWCNKEEKGTGYAPFSISRAGGEKLQLMNTRGVIVDSVVMPALDDNRSYGRDESGKWAALTQPTPGYPNTTAGSNAYSEAHRNAESKVRISELMSKNGSILLPSGTYEDWIELENTSDEEISLAGMYLTDDPEKMKYMFPDGAVIPPNGYMVLACTGTASEGSVPFRLSYAGGEKVLLLSHTGVILDEVTTERLEDGQSYARTADGTFTVCSLPTPGFENTEAGYNAYAETLDPVLTGIRVRITEVLADNTAGITDSEGGFPDWIEIENCGEVSAELEKLYLSDNPENPDKWQFPKGTLAPGERLVVFADGKAKAGEGEIHTNFSLTSRGETLVLSLADGRVLDTVTYAGLGENESYALGADGNWIKTRYATPGAENTETAYIEGLARAYPQGDIVISEVMTGNTTQLKTSKTYYDWVEVRNNSDRKINLGDYFFCKTPDGEKAALPSVKLGAGKYCVLLLYGSEQEREDGRKKGVVFSLADDEDTLFLVDAAGTVSDHAVLRDIPYQGSYGRLVGEEGFFYFETPTPGEKNGDGFRFISDTPVTDLGSGRYDGKEAVTVTLSAKGAIHYTLDGSDPTEKDPLYTEPLTFTSPTVLSAAAFEEGKLKSTVLRQSYIINAGHTLPVVSVVTDPKNLEGSSGILAAHNRYDRTVERYAHFDLLYADETISADCGLKLHGAGSRARNIKKSYKLIFAKRYGTESPLYENFFGDGKEHAYSILLRAGDDMKRAYVRDEIVSYLVHDIESETMTMDTQFCVLYINGEYRGLYTIRNAFSSGYFSLWRGVNKDTVETQRGYVAGDTEFVRLNNWVKSHDLRVEENYRYVCDRVCVDSLIDWCIYEGFTANHDIGVNVRYLRSTEYEDNRWHYALFDTDYGFDTPATFDYVMKSAFHGAIPKKMFKNKDFQKRFLTRMAYLCENYLTPEAISARVDEIVAEIEPEIARDWKLYKRSSSWQAHFKRFQMFENMDRVQQLKESAAEYMGISLEEVESYFHKA